MEIFDKNSAGKIQSKTYKEVNPPCLMPNRVKLPLVLKTTHFNHRDREETADFLKLYNGLNQLEKQTNKKLSTVTLEAKGKHCYMYHNGHFCLILPENYENFIFISIVSKGVISKVKFL